MLPDRWNPRLWLRNSIRAFLGWLWKPSPDELVEAEIRRREEWDDLSRKVEVKFREVARSSSESLRATWSRMGAAAPDLPGEGVAGDRQ